MNKYLRGTLELTLYSLVGGAAGMAMIFVPFMLFVVPLIMIERFGFANIYWLGIIGAVLAAILSAAFRIPRKFWG